jgi:trk system potassium uptake protein TrkA
MAKEKQKVFAVIGLGTFGVQLCEELSEKGGKVLAIDNQERLIEKVKETVSQSILMDSTDEEAMGQVPFEDVDTAIVAIGDNVEASIITTALLKRIGIPRILARAVTDIHQQILRQVGADEIVNIEIDEGIRLAQQLISPDVLDRISISESISLGEVLVPGDFVGRNLKDLDLRNRMKVTVVAIRRFAVGIDEEGNTVRTERIVFPDAGDTLAESDVLLVVGMNEAIDSFKDF